MERGVLVVHLDCGRTWGGGQAQVLMLLEGLHSQKHRNILLCRSGCPLARKASAAGAASVAKVTFGVITMPTVVSALRRVCETEQVDIIHLHDSRSHSIAALFVAGVEARPKIVVSRRVAFGGHPSSFSRWKYRHGADHYIAISRAAADSVIAHGVSEDKISIVPSCYPNEPDFTRKNSCQLREQIGVDRKTRVIGTIGGLTKIKGQRVLLDAFRTVLEDHPDTVLVIAGEGPERDALTERIQDLGIEDKVFLLGFVEDLSVFYEDVGVFVLPSFSEGLNTSILQAMAWEIPCVASDVGGVPDAIEPEREGLLVPPGDPEALSGAIARLLSDSDLSDRLARSAGKKAVSQFSKERMVLGTESVYQDLLKEGL